MPIPRDQSAQRRWPDRRIAQDVAVMSRSRTEPGVEIRTCRQRPVDPYRIWKMSINAHHPRLRTPTHRIIEMNDLRKAVHPRIGAARASGHDRHARHCCQGALERFLNGRH